MPQGDLHELLYSTRCDGNTSTQIHVTMAQRLSIAVDDVTDALEYLHYGIQGTTIVRNRMPVSLRGGGGELGNLKP
jgi:hypothetical protein